MKATVRIDKALDTSATLGGGINVSTRLNAQMVSGVASWNGETGDVTYTPPVTSVNGQTGDVVLSADVASVNGKTGDVVLNATDVGALPDSYAAPVSSVNSKTGTVTLSATDVGAIARGDNVSSLTNDAGYITAKEAPVTSVNKQTGDVALTAKDVGAIPDSTTIPTKTSDLNNDSGFVDATGANEASIFWATYGTTTFAQLQAAWDAGKQILCYWSNRAYSLIYVGTSFTFGYVWGSTTYRLACSSSNVWSNTSQTMQEQVTANGILKGNGSGNVSAAVGGTDYARMSDLPTVPTDVSAFNNDAGYVTATTAPVTSVNGQTGDVTGLQPAGDYAASAVGDTTHTALKAAGIMYGECDNTSTSTAFTATVSGVTSYYDGLTILLYNGVVTSASGFTININGLGALPSYNNMAMGNPVTPTAPTRDTTIFNINYAMLITYSSIVSGGCWIMYRGYDANTNTIAYQVRTNSSTLHASQKFYRYRLLFTSADNTKWVPANTSTSTNATASREVNQTPIDPFGAIVYYGSTTAIEANANVSAGLIWQQYNLTLGYSFNRTGAALVLPYPKPIYIKCAPQTDGSAIIDSTTPYVTALPTTNDGNIYIYLGRTYSATQIELTLNHPVYYHNGNGIRLWTGGT